MVESLLVVALLALGLVWINSKSKDKEIERLNYRERHRTGNLNTEDIEEEKRLRDWWEYSKIYQQLEEEERSMAGDYIDEDYIKQRAKLIFKSKFGYDYRE